VNSLESPALLGVFAVAAIATWVAGVYLSKATDALDERLGLGDALGGMVLLAVAGSLPELAITVSAAASGNLGLAAGNLVGGIAVQTCVLVMCDAATEPKSTPLSYLVGSLIPVLEGVLVVAVTTIMLMGSLLKSSIAIGPVSPASIAIVIVWLVGIFILNKVRKAPKWAVHMTGGQPGRPHRRAKHEKVTTPFSTRSTAVVILVFVAASVVTLLAGVFLEVSGSSLASNAGINGVIFGATFISVATALPEISTGIVAVRMGDNQLAMGDIFGGNAFQLCLFLVADLIAGKPLMPAIGIQNAWLGSLGILLTTVYIASVVVRPERCRLRLGIDSIAVIALYAVGIVGLATLPS
jgi:cation:H+ antiporter